MDAEALYLSLEKDVASSSSHVGPAGGAHGGRRMVNKSIKTWLRAFQHLLHDEGNMLNAAQPDSAEPALTGRPMPSGYLASVEPDQRRQHEALPAREALKQAEIMVMLSTELVRLIEQRIGDCCHCNWRALKQEAGAFCCIKDGMPETHPDHRGDDGHRQIGLHRAPRATGVSTYASAPAAARTIGASSHKVERP